MHKTLIAVALSALSVSNAHALSAGDVAFTAFNADEDGWALVVLAPMAPNTTVFFSDNTLSATQRFGTSESFLTWNTGGAAINAGSVVRFIAQNVGNDYTSVSASVGLLSVTVDGNAGLSASGETLYAYQALAHDAAGQTFLAAVSSESAANAATAIAHAGLTAGVNAVAIASSADFGEYTGPRAGEAAFSAYAARVNNSANWTVLTTGEQAGTVPNSAAFSVSVVPEPGSSALLLAGLTAVGTIARRRRA